jgi:hypothetical protein
MHLTRASTRFPSKVTMSGFLTALAALLVGSGTVTTPIVAAGTPAGTAVGSVQFVAAPSTVHNECQQTADTVKYAVPCPTLLPVGMEPTPGAHGCRIAFMAADTGAPNCGGALWRGWIFGSIQADSRYYTAGFQHLVMQGTPYVVRNPVQAIDGPGKLPHGVRVQPLGAATISGTTMHWYFVPPNANYASAFQQHLVLVWTAAGHTYAYGFHIVATLAEARALDLELARHLLIVEPRHG